MPGCSAHSWSWATSRDCVRCLGEIYGKLELPFDEASVGSLTGEVPTLTVEAVERAVLAAWGAAEASPEALDPETVELAQELVAQHRV